MQSLALYALPGVVLVSVLGALVTVFVMLRWGSSPADTAFDEDLEGEADAAARKLVQMVRRDRAVLRERAIRVGYTVAVTCFASAAVLAGTALLPGSIRRPVDVDARSAQMKEAQGRLEERVRALEERLAAAKTRVRVPPASSEAPTLAPRSPSDDRATPASQADPATKPAPRPPPSLPSRAPASPRPESPERHAPTSVGDASGPLPPGPLPAAGENPGRANAPSAAPDGAAAVTRTSVGSVRLEILRDPERPAPGVPMTCTVRLSDVDGTPLTGASVTVYGQTADGSTVRTKLEPTRSAGTYAGALAVTSKGPWDLRLRVARRETTFELDLERPVPW